MSMTIKFFIILMMSAPMMSAALPERSPDRLSDIYRFLTIQLEKELGPGLGAKHTVIGRSWNIIKTGTFHRVDSSLEAFEFQGLRFLKAHLEFKGLQVDPDAFAKWELKVQNIDESRTSLFFSLKSLESRMRDESGDSTLVLRSDIAKQEIILRGQGSFAFISASG